MILEHFIIARGSAVDTDTNSFSIFDLIEDINIQTNLISNLVIPIQVIAVLKRSPDEKGPINTTCVFTLKDPKGSLLLNEQNIPITMVSDHVRYRLRINCNFNVTSSGTYKFTIENSNKYFFKQSLESTINLININ